MDIIIGEKNKKNKNYNYLICEKLNCNNNLHLSLISKNLRTYKRRNQKNKTCENISRFR